jgi:hypothetical protein
MYFKQQKAVTHISGSEMWVQPHRAYRLLAGVIYWLVLSEVAGQVWLG